MKKHILLMAILMMSFSAAQAMDSSISIDEFDADEQVSVGHQAGLDCKPHSQIGDVATDLDGPRDVEVEEPNSSLR